MGKALDRVSILTGVSIDMDAAAAARLADKEICFRADDVDAWDILSLLSWMGEFRYGIQGGRVLVFSDEAYVGADLPAEKEPGPLTRLGRNAQGVEQFRHEPTGIVFVRVPPGEFDAGSPEDEFGHTWDEARRHVKIEKSFLLSRTPVTNEQFRRFAVRRPLQPGHTSGKLKDVDLNGDDSPVVLVSVPEIAAFSRTEGLRLPTEEEWEYVARGGDARLFPWGDAWPPPSRTEGSAANPFGVRDLGRVWECCGGAELRGGAWCISRPSLLRCAKRLAYDDGAGDRSVGFRVALDAPE